MRTPTAGLFVAVLILALAAPAAADPQDLFGLNPSSNFILSDENNETFQLKDHRGKVVLLFFGYLSCPDVCPVTLSKLTRVIDRMGEEPAEDLLVAFVTVDPSRDSAEKLKDYIGFFDLPATGLRGSQTEVNGVIKAYGGWHEQVRSESALGYLINHSAYIYVIGPEGHVRALLHHDDPVEKMERAVREVLQARP